MSVRASFGIVLSKRLLRSHPPRAAVICQNLKIRAFCSVSSPHLQSASNSSQDCSRNDQVEVKLSSNVRRAGSVEGHRLNGLVRGTSRSVNPSNYRDSAFDDLTPLCISVDDSASSAKPVVLETISKSNVLDLDTNKRGVQSLKLVNAGYCTASRETVNNNTDVLTANLADRNSSTVRETIITPLMLCKFPPNLKAQLFIAAGLSKARLSCLVLFTAVVGCGLAASTSLTSPLFLDHPIRTIICLALGTGLTSAAANSVNQILEIPNDSQMLRTQNRVLVRGLTTPGRAGVFALGFAGLGLGLLYWGVNPLVTSMAAGNILLYSLIYTPLKQIDQANTWIGSIVGAIPPLMGWAAATGDIHSGALILASLLYVWQFPHFMSLSWNLRNEYSKAGYMMTAVLDPDLCKRVTLRYAVASGFVCLAGAGCSAISLGPWAGCALGLGCLPPNIGLMYYAWQFVQSPADGSSAAARRLFRATLFHLPVVMLAALSGTYFCVN
ncbi:unnamed protein product [Calicophoron daubneyi]|uniref:Heme O synthase n=1 Tax=Calicophoron daubneyi TaxID=300641 RepID=A0AAV2T0X7_CALDB